jgi:phage terminase large subunit
MNGIHRVSEVEALGHRRVHKDCKEWKREKGLYAWDSKAAEGGKEQPLKINDHTMDADRYANVYLFPEFKQLKLLEAA